MACRMARHRSGLCLWPHSRDRSVRWAQVHRTGPLAGPGGSSRAAHARCAPPPPHAPPRARTRRSAHTAPDLPARTGPARTQRAAVSPRPLARPRPQVCATTAARAADGDAARRGEPAAAKRWSGAGSIPERPAGLPVALESYSSRGRGRRAAGDGMRMRLSIRFSLFDSRSSAVAASPVSCKKIFTYSFTTRLTPSPLDVLCGVWCSTAFVFLFYFKPRDGPGAGRTQYSVAALASRRRKKLEGDFFRSTQ